MMGTGYLKVIQVANEARGLESAHAASYFSSKLRAFVFWGGVAVLLALSLVGFADHYGVFPPESGFLYAAILAAATIGGMFYFWFWAFAASDCPRVSKIAILIPAALILLASVGGLVSSVVALAQGEWGAVGSVYVSALSTVYFGRIVMLTLRPPTWMGSI